MVVVVLVVVVGRRHVAMARSRCLLEGGIYGRLSELVVGVAVAIVDLHGLWCAALQPQAIVRRPRLPSAPTHAETRRGSSAGTRAIGCDAMRPARSQLYPSDDGRVRVVGVRVATTRW